MEFYLCRALEIARLTAEQLSVLHEAETKKGLGCLAPSGIQSTFGLTTLKEHYKVPVGGKAAERLAAAHWLRCAGLLADRQYLSGFMPPAVVLQEGNIEAVHLFDSRIFQAVLGGKLTFMYGADEPEEEPAHDPDAYRPMHGGRGRIAQTDFRTAASDGYQDR